MAGDEDTERRDLHRTFAVQLFSLVWELLDREDRTAEEDERMVHAAHASHFHWGEIGAPLESERGEWQISRAYSVLGRPQAAIHHAQRCPAICEARGIGDFGLAFAFEALARGHAAAEDADRRPHYLQLARQAAQQIKGQDDREHVLSELDTIG